MTVEPAGTMIYEGKAKKIFTTDRSDQVVQYFKDDATAFNAQKRGTINGQGVLNNRVEEAIRAPVQLLESGPAAGALAAAYLAGAQEPRICAIPAAMLRGTGLDAFAAHYPERCFDVGIAEGHAVSMAGGLAKQGMIPVVAIYSTFLQRAYDMLLQDVAMLGLHVVFAVDRAGLVGGGRQSTAMS